MANGLSTIVPNGTKIADHRRRASDVRDEHRAPSWRSVHLLCWASSSSVSPRSKCWRGASTVRAAGPTAWPAHSSAHLIDADLDAMLASLLFLGRRNPTDPLVSCQRGDIGPKAFGSAVGFDGSPK